MSQYIKSPMNYTGGKHKILKHIIPSFPSRPGTFVDLFAGGFNVGINVDADTIYANDHITYLIDLYKMFRRTPIDELLHSIQAKISAFGLTQSNEDGYNALRSEYNRTGTPLDLFVLTCFSFNHQIRFNNSHQFNSPFGRNRSSYNSAIEQNTILFCKALREKEIRFSTVDFMDFDFSLLKKGDFVYCDPPYLITTGAYNDGRRGFKDWTKKEDSQLFSLLDSLDGMGIRFALSDVFDHKGISNDELIKWSHKYNVYFIDKSYSNCSYHLKGRDAKTTEVLVMNYQKPETEMPKQLRFW